MTAAATQNGRARGSRVPSFIPTPEPQPPAAAANTDLMAAILRVQATLPKLATNADGQVGGRFYRYADLGMVVDAALPLLVDEQLAWVTFPTSDEHGQPALRYRMTHLSSGQFEEDVMPLMCAKPDPQGQGSALTYSRRYALCAVLNITIGDDDGAAASPPGPAAGASGVQPSARAAGSGDRPASAPQKRMLRAKAHDAGLPASGLADVLKLAGGDTPAPWQDEAAAERWLDRALDRLPARLVDAVILGIEQAAAGAKP